MTGAEADPDPDTEPDTDAEDGRAEEEIVSPTLKLPDWAKTSLMLLLGRLSVSFNELSP